jgi:hypothetical protein
VKQNGTISKREGDDLFDAMTQSHSVILSGIPIADLPITEN